MKKLAALLTSFAMIFGTQIVMAEELSVEDITFLKAIGLDDEAVAELEAIALTVEDEDAVANFEKTIACFTEEYNTGPFVYDITGSEIIRKKADGTIEEKYTIKYKSQNFISSYKPHYTDHFTATQQQYKSETQLTNSYEKIGGWGAEPEPDEKDGGGYYLWFEFITFNTKTLELRTRQQRVVGGTREDRDEGLLGFYYKCVIIP